MKMLGAIVFFSFALVTESVDNGGHSMQVQGAPPLEIRVVKTSWTDDCLLITMDRINHSDEIIFFSPHDLWVSYPVRILAEDFKTIAERGWIPAYGLSDLKSWQAETLAPGTKTREEHCVPGDVFVLDDKRETHRRVPVSSKIQIKVFYYKNHGDWLAAKAKDEAEGASRTTDESEAINAPRPSVSIFVASIPCRSVGCAHCELSPVILPNERVVMPDYARNLRDWNERGKVLAKKLSQKFPSCGSGK